MLGKLFGKDKKDAAKSARQSAIEHFSKLSEKWNFEDIQNYIRGKKEGQEVNDAGLASILQRFNTYKTDDKKTESGKRREFEIFDRPERTKKGFDIVIAIAGNAKLGVDSLELLKEFSEVYSDVIKDLDTQLSQTYKQKLKDAYSNANVRALTKATIQQSLALRDF